jgi:hypothetical protein
MRGHADGGVFGLAVETGGLAVADDLHGGLGAVGGAVRDDEELAVELCRAGLEVDLVAEEGEQGDDPLLAVSDVAGDSGLRVSSLRWKMRQ